MPDVDISSEMEEMENLLSNDSKDIDDLRIEEADDDGEEVDIEPKKSRKEQRKERGELWTAYQAEREARIRAETAERLRAQQQGQMAELLRRPEPQQQQGPHPVRQRLDALYAQQENLNSQYEEAQRSGSLTPQQAAEMRREHRLLNEQVQATIAMARAPRQEQQDPAALAREAVKAQNYARNRDVYDNQRAIRWAEGQFIQREAELTDADGNFRGDPQDLHDLVMAEARKKFGMRRDDRREPTRAERRRHESQGRAGREGTGKKTVRMGREQRQMADALYPDLEPAERYKKWAREVGVDL